MVDLNFADRLYDQLESIYFQNIRDTNITSNVKRFTINNCQQNLFRRKINFEEFVTLVKL